jgi:hypothetical protein
VAAEAVAVERGIPAAQIVTTIDYVEMRAGVVGAGGAEGTVPRG